jgi:hypothetical protein
MLQNLEQEFEQFALAVWERSKSPLERMYDHWVGEGQWEPDPPTVTYRIYEKITGRPIPCHLCGSTDKWVAEGDEVRQIVRVFVCEHEPVSIGRGAIRQVSSVPFPKVGHIEETSRPLE